jgi:hypothetical protein
MRKFIQFFHPSLDGRKKRINPRITHPHLTSPSRQSKGVPSNYRELKFKITILMGRSGWVFPVGENVPPSILDKVN